MTRALEAVDGKKIDPEIDGGLCVADGGAFMQDGAVRLFKLLDDGARAVAGSFDDTDAFVNNDFGVGVVIGRDEGGEEGQVDGERAGGHGAASSNLGPEGFRVGLGEGCKLDVSDLRGVKA